MLLAGCQRHHNALNPFHLGSMCVYRYRFRCFLQTAMVSTGLVELCILLETKSRSPLLGGTAQQEAGRTTKVTAHPDYASIRAPRLAGGADLEDYVKNVTWAFVALLLTNKFEVMSGATSHIFLSKPVVAALTTAATHPPSIPPLSPCHHVQCTGPELDTSSQPTSKRATVTHACHLHKHLTLPCFLSSFQMPSNT